MSAKKTFYEATGELCRAVTQQDVADWCGVSLGKVAQARMNPTLKGHMKPPKDWEMHVATLAMHRAEQLVALAWELWYERGS